MLSRNYSREVHVRMLHAQAAFLPVSLGNFVEENQITQRKR